MKSGEGRSERLNAKSRSCSLTRKSGSTSLGYLESAFLFLLFNGSAESGGNDTKLCLAMAAKNPSGVQTTTWQLALHRGQAGWGLLV
jgi:hypothetical protein